ncbi:hypothetical protein OCV99_01845 [Dorea acetigenes]|uniref:Uncharacterized protein n=1 Tax=Dorea acetigenes TaxID=2981787 RepID=A0ABT2RIW7_9FIRM|nr:hypothetical protein [Dorea acetigenes]MCU6685305.1 hypothetical protein [Dorea acetigenes]
MIVETKKRGECTCHIDDSGYSGKNPEEVERIIQTFSEFILECLRKRNAA